MNIVFIDPNEGWSLEIVNEHGTSTIWDEVFVTEQDAWDEFVRVVDQEEPEAFFDDGEPLNRIQ